MKKIFTLLWVAAFGCLASIAQIVTTQPPILQTSSQGVVLTYNAASPLGNGGLKGLSPSAAVYAHIGCITNRSVNTSDWKYGPTSWGDNAPKYKLNYGGSADTWLLEIGNMREYFGITDPTETIQKLAVVFRTDDCTKEGKTKSGGDIFVDVTEDGFQMLLLSDAPGTVVSEPTTVKLTVHTTEPANITLTCNGTPLGNASSANILTCTYNITGTGNYTFEATATNAQGVTKTQRTSVALPGKSQAGTYPGGTPKMGTVKNSDGTVTFCLAAPGKESVVIVPSWNDYQVLESNTMKYQDYNGQRYFFITVSGLQDNVWYPYYYIVDAKYKVADPYANLVLDCYSDKWLDKTIWPDMPQYPYDKFDDTMLAVYRGDLNGTYQFPAFEIPDHKNLIIYELLLRDFTGTEGASEGNGTLAQAIEKIPYLKSLGVNCIELLPVMEFNGNNSWGYNTNFYMAPDKAYGSPGQLRDFISLCHMSGMAVVLDIVFNQSDGLHPWYQMYPIDSNPFYNKNAPHAYSVLNDWKQENPLVRQQWKDAITYWMKEYDVDGFRFDLVKGLGTSYGSNTDAYNASRVAVMKDLHSAITAVKTNGIHINENLAGAQEEIEMGNDGQLNWANINNQSCQVAMGYPSNAAMHTFLSTDHESRPAFSTVSYAESHDEERMGYKQDAYGATTVKGKKDISAARMGQVAVQMLLTPGPKMIWQFGELGANETTKDKDGGNATHPKKVIWNNLQDADYKALHDTYQALCNLRTQHPDLFTQGSYTPLNLNASNFTNVRIQRHVYGDMEVVAFVNCNVSGAAKATGTTLSKINAANCKLIAASPNFSDATLVKSGTSWKCTVPPNAYAVFATNNALAGVEDLEADLTAPAATVAVDGNNIVINGEYTSAQAYNLAGQAVGMQGLRPGLYLVNVDGQTHKVMVR